MTYGQAVRKAVTDSVNRTGTDCVWRIYMPAVFRDVYARCKKVTER